jgi:hypothetical protein
MAVRQLTERMDAVEAAHERLRGRFYQLKGPQNPQNTNGQLSKAELLAKFVPRR